MREYIKRDGDRIVILMPKEIDHHAAASMAEEIDMQIESFGVRKLEFDFSNSEFMDSSGIGFVIARTRKVGFFGGEACAVSLNKRMQRMFQAAGLDQMVRMKED